MANLLRVARTVITNPSYLFVLLLLACCVILLSITNTEIETSLYNTTAFISVPSTKCSTIWHEGVLLFVPKHSVTAGGHGVRLPNCPFGLLAIRWDAKTFI